MEDSRDDLSLQIQQLRLEVGDLRRRLVAIEEQRISCPAGTAADCEPAAAIAADTDSGPAEALLPLFGWAFLGLSGAYLLRAATESGALPILAGVIAGLLYASWWMYLAARRAWRSRVASTVHSATAALILAPLLWEATVRFHSLTAAAASVLVVAFAVFGLVIGWRHRITAMASVATLAGLITTFALFRETHNAAAWAGSVLAIAAAVEFSACRDHWLSLRWAAALIADLVILIVTMLAARPGAAVVTGALALGAQISLLCIYLASTADRTLIRRLPITGFEIGQAIVAFVVGVGGALYLQELTSVGRLPVGLFCLGCSLTCYVISYAVIDRDAAQNRNFYAYSSFGAGLMIVASRVLLPPEVVPVAWAALAAALVCAGLVRMRLTLRVHGAVLLILAALASGAVQEALSWLIQTVRPDPEGLSVAYAATLVSALVCYGFTVVGAQRARIDVSPVEALVPAAVFSWLAAAVVAVFLSQLAAAGVPLRTALMVSIAVVLARTGVIARRRELSWISCLFVAAAGFKILMEDFRGGRSLAVFISLTLFGATLVLLPRLSRVVPEHKSAMRARA